MRKDKGEGRPSKERGRELTQISYQCRIGRHKDCSAMRCPCTCGHKP